MSIPYPFHVHKEQSVPIRTNRLGHFITIRARPTNTLSQPGIWLRVLTCINTQPKPSLEEASAARVANTVTRTIYSHLTQGGTSPLGGLPDTTLGGGMGGLTKNFDRI